MRAHFDRRGRYRGHSEGAGGLILRGVLVLLVLGWPFGLGLGWIAWLIAVPWYLLLAVLALVKVRQ